MEHGRFRVTVRLMVNHGTGRTPMVLGGHEAPSDSNIELGTAEKVQVVEYFIWV